MSGEIETSFAVNKIFFWGGGLFKCCFKIPVCSSYEKFLTLVARQFVYSFWSIYVKIFTFVIQYVIQLIAGFKWNMYIFICLFEQLGYVRCFVARICEWCPFVWFFRFYLLPCCEFSVVFLYVSLLTSRSFVCWFRFLWLILWCILVVYCTFS